MVKGRHQDQHADSPHAREAEEVLKAQGANSEQGLSEDEVRKRRKEYGENKLPERGGMSAVMLFLKQFKDFLILILFIAAGVAWLAGQMTDVYIIAGVILFNAIMGFTQEYRAEKAIASIKSMVEHKATAIRQGKQQQMKAAEIVPGDIIVLEQGETVPADARLFQVRDLRAAESSLTGEPEAVAKETEKLEADTVLADRVNMVWKGTHVVKGSGRGVVVATGENTEIGKIAETLEEMEKTESNFRRKTARLARIMAIIAVGTSALVFAVGYFYRSLEFQEILLVTIATLVSSIPEGLPVVISIVLAIGANRMAKRNAIIREFTATEELGSVTTILSDKTGTITQSILSVKKIAGIDDREWKVTGQGYETEGKIENNGREAETGGENKMLTKILTIAAFCNKATLEKSSEGEQDQHEEAGDESENQEIEVRGDPTEVALLVLAKKSGIREQEPFDKVKIVDDLPFNSEQKYRATLIRYEPGDKELLVVGAPERVLELSTTVFTGEDTREAGEQEREFIRQKNDEWAEQAMRIIALAHKDMQKDKEEIAEDDVKDLRWTGIVGIMDPPRAEVKDAVKACGQAGIRVIQVTGDHKKTAAAIAEEVGIAVSAGDGENYPDAVSEKDIGDLDDEKFDDIIRYVSVFARVSPKTKLRIAERLHAKNELIAMTGDGVNDALTLKKADVGIAMGQRGTDVAKDAAQIVLSDDNFASIVNAVREGRIIFQNVKIVSYFLLTTNFAATTTLIAALVIGFPIPLTAVQILWVNMVTDGVMDIGLATEPGHGDIMKRKPIKKDERILHWEVLPYLLIIAAIMVSLALATFYYYLPQGEEMARTGAFLVIAMTQVFNVFNMRDLKESVFRIGIFSNKWVNLAFIASLLLQFAVIKIPFMQNLFEFTNISIAEFLIITAMSTIILWVGELYKWIQRKRANSHAADR